MAYAAYIIRPDATVSSSDVTGGFGNLVDNSGSTGVFPRVVSTTGTARYSLGTATISGLGSTNFIHSVTPVACVGPSTATEGFVRMGVSGAASSGNSTVGSYIATTISQIARASDGLVTVTTSSAHGMTVAATGGILISGNTSHTWANGAWTLVSATGSTLTFYHPETSVVSTAASNGTAYSAQLIGTPNYTTASGAAWTQTDIDDAFVDASFLTFSGTLTGAYEAWVVVSAYDYATMTITAIGNDSSSPFSSVTDTSRPLIQWSYSQAQNLPQTAVVLKIFSTTTADPENATPLWTTTVTGTTNSATVGIDLAASSTYYLYYKVATGGNGAQNFGAWNNVSLTMSLTVPTAPTISGSWSSVDERVTLTVNGSSFASGSQTFQVQRSDDGGTTWVVVRGAEGGNFTAASASPSTWTVYDYEAKRSVTNRYRVKSLGLVGTSSRVSAFSSTATVSVTSIAAWSMLSLNPSSSDSPLDTQIKNVPVQVQSQVSIEESVGVFRPIGGSKSVVVHGTLTGQDGRYSVVFSSTANRDTFLSLINSQKTIAVFSPLNDVKYIRVISREFTLTGTTSVPMYSFEIDYVEVDSGLSAGS